MNRRGFITASAELAAAVGSASAALAAGADVSLKSEVSFAEAPIDPDWPIIDAHHHLWDHPAGRGNPPDRYLLPEFLADVGASGHHITQTVFVDCMTMYRDSGPVEMRSLGETEFVNGLAAMSASGGYGPCRVAAGIVAFVDLRLGDASKPVLEAHIAAAGGRMKGVRNSAAWDAYPVMGMQLGHERAEWLGRESLRTGLAILAAHDLAFETWIFHTQIPQVTELAAAVPQARIVLDHIGTPLAVGPYAGKTKETFGLWRRNLVDLARCQNVYVKLGGLGMKFASPELIGRKPQASSAEIAKIWRPYIENCIELFGPERCMFESNFPPDAASCSYGTLWNVFKLLSAGYSPSERTALFSGTATRVYRLQGGAPES